MRDDSNLREWLGRLIYSPTKQDWRMGLWCIQSNRGNIKHEVQLRLDAIRRMKTSVPPSLFTPLGHELLIQRLSTRSRMVIETLRVSLNYGETRIEELLREHMPERMIPEMVVQTVTSDYFHGLIQRSKNPVQVEAYQKLGELLSILESRLTDAADEWAQEKDWNGETFSRLVDLFEETANGLPRSIAANVCTLALADAREVLDTFHGCGPTRHIASLMVLAFKNRVKSEWILESWRED